MLARPGSNSIQSSLLQGATIATVDYTDATALASILEKHNVEVVISALAYGALAAQRHIADAAKEAGVKLFVPSEYGMPTEGGKDGHLVIKSEFAGKFATVSQISVSDNDVDYVKSLGIPVLRVYVRSVSFVSPMHVRN